MGISGSQPALMQARFGVARFGATRFGYITPRLFVSFNGTDLSSLVLEGSVSIHQALNDEPDTATFVVIENEVLTPIPGMDVVIGTGSLIHREFGGQISRVVETLTPGVTRPIYTVSCRDFGKRFDRRLVTKLWTNLSIAAIAADIVDTYTDGFTRNNIDPTLPTLEYFQATNRKPSELFRRLGMLAGGAYYIDEDRDVHLFGQDGEYRPRTNPLDLDDTALSVTLESFARERDNTQWRSRVIVEGMGTKVLAPVGVGEAIIPVESADIFNVAGGRARVEQELVTYTGLVSGGPGSLVGPGVAPPSWLGITPAAGAGIESGHHEWAFTWVTASGETLPSPVLGSILGPLSTPTTAPARSLATGGELGTGTYQYAVTFVVGAGETTPGPTGSVTTNVGIAAPGSSPSLSATNAIPQDHFGGRYVAGDSVWVRVSYLDVNGNETGGTDSNTVVAVDMSPGVPYAVAVTNIPVPSDPNVVSKRLYLHVNAGFVAYIDRPLSQTSYLFSGAGFSTGSFPIGGDPTQERVQLTSIPLGGTGVTARKLYRTVVNGSDLKLLATIGDNTTTSYLDAIADGSLGAAVPSTNTTQMNQASLTGIAVGPSGVTSRKVYRTLANAGGGSQLKLLTTLGDNTTTTYTDSTADGSLGANVPTNDTSGLTQVTGQVNAGSTTMQVAGPGAFNTGGGWARVGEQVIRYSGISGSTLTGIPASGVGALQATVTYGTTITEAPRLTGVSGLAHAITRGEAIYLRVQQDDATSQAAIAADEGEGDGVYEHTIVDHRLSEDGATERALAELAAFGRTLAEVEWETADMNARPGRRQGIQLVQSGGSPNIAAIAEDLLILSADVTFPAPDVLPRRRCRAGTVKRAQTIDVAELQRD